jgi:hypothetical protein
MKYDKFLKARFSPENGCFVEDGELLTVVPKSKLPANRQVAHHFLDVATLKKRSRYGWVADSEPLTLEEFIERFHPDSKDDNLRDHVRRMLDAVAKQALGTPMAAGYTPRGLGNRQMEFIVHRVFFHGRGPADRLAREIEM